MLIHERGTKWTEYIEDGYGLTIDATYENDKGTITSWELSKAPDVTYHGSTKDEFLELLDELIHTLNLKKYEDKKCKKDLVVIYTDNIEKILGFFTSELTDRFSDIYCEIKDYFEFRSIEKWKKLEHDSMQIAKCAEFLIHTLFIPNKYFFLTPQQIPRRAISKACKNSKDTTAKKIFPVSLDDFSRMRKALFGGIVYLPYRDIIITEQLLCLDLTSAYIYDLLIEKHCSSAFERVDTSTWEYYTESKNKTSLGMYNIKYSCATQKIHCFKSVDGEHFETGIHTVKCIMTSIDLKIFLELANVEEITCEWLYECDIDTLPQYMLDEIVKQYEKKVDLVEDKKAYTLQKRVVNSIFGDCITKIESKEAFESAKRAPSVAPQWGIWCTSYAKKNLLELGMKVEGWVYSDTDSIYCFDTEENRKLLEEYNQRRREKVKAFCDKYGYDFEKLKDLGSFKIEKTIKKFRAISQKVYMYETTEGEFKLTAAGLDQTTIKVSKELFEKKKIDYGSRLIKFVGEDNYYEKRIGGEELLLISLAQLEKIPEQY